MVASVGRSRPVRRCVIVLAVAGLAFVALSAAGGLVGTASADDVTGCTTIQNPGTYNLTTDITDTSQAPCITINSSDVIFDGGGHVVDYDGSNNGGDGILVKEGMTNVTVRNVTVTDWTRGGINYDGSSGRITEVNATDNDQGIRLERTTADPSIDNNTLLDNTDGVDAGGARGATIRDNEFRRNGITMQGASEDLTIESNTIESDDIGIFLQGQGHVISDNTIRSPGNDGIFFQKDNPIGQDDVRIENNTVRDSAGNGIELEGQAGVALDTVTIRDNTLTNSSINEIRVQNATNIALQGNNVSSTGEDGIYVGETTNLSVSDTTIDDTGGNGLLVQGTVNDPIRIQNVTTRNNGDNGVETGDNATLENVTATQNGANGIDTQVNARILNSTVKNNNFRGVEADDNATAVNLTAKGSGFQGFDPKGDATIRDSVIENVGNRGIEANENLTVRNVTVRNSNGEGISANDGLVVEDSNVSNNQGQGIDFGTQLGAGGAAKIRNVTVVGNSDTGIDLDNGIGAVVRNVTVRDSGDLGIDAGSDVLLENVRVVKSTDADVEMETNVTARNLDLGNSTAENTTVDFQARNVNITGVSNPPSDPTGEQNISRYVGVKNTTEGPAYLDVTFQYEDGDVSNVEESSLSLWRNNASGWTDIGGTVDEGANTVSKNITNYSVFAPLASQEASTGDGDDGDDDGDDDDGDDDDGDGSTDQPDDETATPADDSTDQPDDETATPADDSTDRPDDETATTTEEDGPGFGPMGAVVALLAGAVLLARRR